MKQDIKQQSKFQKALYNQNIPYLIGETAYIHEGDFQYLSNLVKEMINKKCCDAIKFHVMTDVDSYATPSHELYKLYKKMKLPQKKWLELFKLLKSSALENIILVDDIKSMNFVKKNINLIDAVELHAIALNNIEMLEKIKEINLPTILGVGGSKLEDIEFALNYLKKKDILLMHGFQNYPTKYEYINFKKMMAFKDKFKLPVGYADHTIWNSEFNELITLAGFIEGANFLEKHVTLKAGEKRIDFEAAVEIKMLQDIKRKMKILIKTKGNGSFEISDYEDIYAKKGPMKFTTVASKELKKGNMIKKEDITFKRTGEENILEQREYLNLIGKKIKEDIFLNELINWGNIEK